MVQQNSFSLVTHISPIAVSESTSVGTLKAGTYKIPDSKGYVKDLVGRQGSKNKLNLPVIHL
jgi:hypothetical protein